MGVVPPPPGFNDRIARLTSAHGAVLVLDEVMTGFRVAGDGWWGREAARRAWRPDLVHLRQGHRRRHCRWRRSPGTRDLMDLLAPVGPVYQAGTLSGNPTATTAGLVTLQHCTPEVYAHLDRTSAAVVRHRERRPDTARRRAPAQTAGSLFSFFLTDRDVRDYDDARTQDTARVRHVLPHHARQRGLAPAVRLRVLVRVRGAHRRRPCGHRAGRRSRCSRHVSARPRGPIVLGDQRFLHAERCQTHRLAWSHASHQGATRVHGTQRGRVERPARLPAAGAGGRARGAEPEPGGRLPRRAAAGAVTPGRPGVAGPRRRRRSSNAHAVDRRHGRCRNGAAGVARGRGPGGDRRGAAPITVDRQPADRAGTDAGRATRGDARRTRARRPHGGTRPRHRGHRRGCVGRHRAAPGRLGCSPARPP